MPRHLDISLLRTFVAVHDRGSMTAAAAALHLTQGAVSQQVKRLEQLLNTPLFQRKHRSLALTGAGDRLLARARAVLALNDQVWAEMAVPVSRPIRLGVPEDLLGQGLASALKAHEAAWPEAEVLLTCAPSLDLFAALERDDLDLALVEAPAGAVTDERFEVRCVGVDQLTWVGASGGSAFSKRPLPVSLVAGSCAFRPAISAALQAQGRAWRTVYEPGTLEATRATVRADLAVTAWLACTVPQGLQVLPADSGLPGLPAFAIHLYQRPGERCPATQALGLSVINALKR